MENSLRSRSSESRRYFFHILPNIPEHVAGSFAGRNSFVFSFGDNSRVSGARRISIVG